MNSFVKSMISGTLLFLYATALMLTAPLIVDAIRLFFVWGEGIQIREWISVEFYKQLDLMHLKIMFIFWMLFCVVFQNLYKNAENDVCPNQTGDAFH